MIVKFQDAAGGTVMFDYIYEVHRRFDLDDPDDNTVHLTLFRKDNAGTEGGGFDMPVVNVAYIMNDEGRTVETVWSGPKEGRSLAKRSG